MAKVIATSLGYFGGELREPGTSFVVPDDIWDDEKRRPSWAKPALFGGKGDHDGDGKPGGTVVAAGEDRKLSEMTVPELRSLAEERGVDLAGLTRKADIVKALEGGNTVQATEAAEVFGDAPAPVRVENEINAATGGTQPDWVSPTPVED